MCVYIHVFILFLASSRNLESRVLLIITVCICIHSNFTCTCVGMHMRRGEQPGTFGMDSHLVLLEGYTLSPEYYVKFGE